MTPEQRALVDGARERAERAARPCPCGNELCSGAPLWTNHFCADSEGVPCEAAGCEVCKTDHSDVPALCDLADEQAKQIVILREGLDIVRSLHDHMSKLYDEAKARIASLEASVALLDAEGRKMKEQRDEAQAANR